MEGLTPRPGRCTIEGRRHEHQSRSTSFLLGQSKSHFDENPQAAEHAAAQDWEQPGIVKGNPVDRFLLVCLFVRFELLLGQTLLLSDEPLGALGKLRVGQKQRGDQLELEPQMLEFSHDAL